MRHRHGALTLMILCLELALAAMSPAQTGERFVIWKSNDPLRGVPPSIYEIDSTGVLRSTIATFPTNTSVEVLGIRGDNKTLLLAGETRVGMTVTQFLADLLPGGNCTTLYQGPLLYRVHGASFDSDGDTYILNSPRNAPYYLEVYRLYGSSLTLCSKSTISAVAQGGVRRDPESGCVFFRGIISAPSQEYGYFRIDPRTGAITSLALLDARAFPIFGCRDTIYEYPSGTCVDVLGDIRVFAQTVRTNPGHGTVLLSRKWWGRNCTGLVRASQRNRGVAYYLISAATSLPVPPQHWDLTPIRPDGTWCRSQYLQGTPPINHTGLVRLGSRNLGWRMVTPPNGRALDLSFPGEGGRLYAVLFSLSGVRPGVPLPDGRHVPIRPDGLTDLSLRGGLPGVLWPTIGRLDAGGNATLIVDTNRFGTGLKNVNLWAAALVFDATSSYGVAWIVGPELLEIRQ